MALFRSNQRFFQQLGLQWACKLSLKLTLTEFQSSFSRVDTKQTQSNGEHSIWFRGTFYGIKPNKRLRFSETWKIRSRSFARWPTSAGKRAKDKPKSKLRRWLNSLNLMALLSKAKLVNVDYGNLIAACRLQCTATLNLGPLTLGHHLKMVSSAMFMHWKSLPTAKFFCGATRTHCACSGYLTLQMLQNIVIIDKIFLRGKSKTSLKDLPS